VERIHEEKAEAQESLRGGVLQIKGTRQIGGRVAPEDCSSEAPRDPDVQISRIRLFGTRIRYATIAGRMCGSGSG
jgi:hypothetical protein